MNPSFAGGSSLTFGSPDGSPWANAVGSWENTSPNRSVTKQFLFYLPFDDGVRSGIDCTDHENQNDRKEVLENGELLVSIRLGR